jgi:hypothetical protein
MRWTRSHLSVVRQSKLDIVKWISGGMERSENSRIVQCLAGYAAEQLTTAAAVPRDNRRVTAGESLLRRHLTENAAASQKDCVRVLLNVSRAMQVLLADEVKRPDTSTQMRQRLSDLLNRERAAFEILLHLSRLARSQPAHSLRRAA